MREWFDRVGYDADIAALRRDFSEVRRHSLQTGRANVTGAFLRGHRRSPEVATRGHRPSKTGVNAVMTRIVPISEASIRSSEEVESDRDSITVVMRGLDPRIHRFAKQEHRIVLRRGWIAGSSYLRATGYARR